MTTPPAGLEITGVTVRAKGQPLVEDVTLEVRPGMFLGLLGPNGAGKSTLLRTVYRMTKPDAGVVRLNGENVWQRSATWVAQHVGAVLQDMPTEFPLTVRDVVAMGRSAHKALLEPDTKHDAALIDASITLQRLEDFQHRAFRTLSGGERQRVLLARALVQQPQILVLDEPTNHLDIRYQLSLLSFLREVGVTVIAALHDLNLAAMFCDQLCLMNNGRVVALGEPEDVLTPALLWDVYGVDVTIQNHPQSGKVLVLPGLT